MASAAMTWHAFRSRSAPALAVLGMVLAAGCLSASSPASKTSEPAAPPTSAAPTASGTASSDETPAGASVGRARIHVLVISDGFYPADPAFKANLTSVPANASVVLTYRDQDLNPLGKHDWTLEGVEGAQTPLVETGHEATIEFVAPLKPGEYVYYCSVPQHRGFGMEGKLTVTSPA